MRCDAERTPARVAGISGQLGESESPWLGLFLYMGYDMFEGPIKGLLGFLRQLLLVNWGVWGYKLRAEMPWESERKKIGGSPFSRLRTAVFSSRVGPPLQPGARAQLDLRRKV